MDEACPAGALSYPGGTIAFGAGQPILCVNDQCGYYLDRPEVLAELHAGRFDALIALAKQGVALGLKVFNVQLMEPTLIGQERELLPAAVAAIYSATGCGIAVDSRDPVTVDLALAAYPYKAMCNTVNGEWDNLKTMLPVIAKHGAALGSALVYEKGVPDTVADRLFVARRIVEAAVAHGIPRADIVIDAVCLPGAVAPGNMAITLQTIRAIHEELGVPTLLGISNAGFAMPNPRLIDLAYFVASAAWGLNVAMIDPATPSLQWLSPAMDFLLGTDPAARGYLGVYRAGKRR
jgi:5-methyltetrahydrofolate--homocysteine methyltransferase